MGPVKVFWNGPNKQATLDNFWIMMDNDFWGLRLVHEVMFSLFFPVNILGQCLGIATALNVEDLSGCGMVAGVPR